jgi:hypothetical protein
MPGGVAQGVSPEFLPQYHTKKKKKNPTKRTQRDWDKGKFLKTKAGPQLAPVVKCLPSVCEGLGLTSSTAK